MVLSRSMKALRLRELEWMMEEMRRWEGVCCVINVRRGALWHFRRRRGGVARVCGSINIVQIAAKWIILFVYLVDDV